MSSTASAVYRVPDNVFVEICRGLLALPLDPENHRHVGSRTVASLAAAARLFHEPALNVLWHTIPDIAVLFCTLGNEVYCKKDVKRKASRWIEECSQFGFNGIPEERQLVRFLAYAQRVREINYEAHVSTRACHFSTAPEAYDTLADILGSRVLLPNVTRINFNLSDSLALQVFRSFHVVFGPKLRLLRIFSHHEPYVGSVPEPYTNDDEVAFARMLQKLTDIRPQLQKLYLWITPTTKSMISAVAAAVCHLDQLVSLKLPHCNLPLTPAAFAHLAKLPCLSYLDLRVDGSDSWADVLLSLSAADPNGAFFPVLRHLELTAPTFALSTELLRFIRSPTLAKLSVTAAEAVPRNELRALFTAIGGLPGAKTVTQLYVNAANVLRADTGVVRRASSPTASEPPPRPIGRTTLEPLLVMSSLDDVMLEICCPFDIDDPLLEAFCEAWPRLDRFRLGVTGGWGLVTESEYAEGDVYPGDDDPRSIDIPDAEREEDAKYAKAWRPPRTTLFGLLAFAEHCPYIDVIQVELDATVRDVPKEWFESRPLLGAPGRGRNKRPTIDMLSVGLSPIDDPYAVAALLSDWIWEIGEIADGWLDMMEGDEDDDEDDNDDPNFDDRDEDVPWSALARVYHRRWEMVRRLVPMFAIVRRQERRWMQKKTGQRMLVKRAEEWKYNEDCDSDADMGFW